MENKPSYDLEGRTLKFAIDIRLFIKNYQKQLQILKMQSNWLDHQDQLVPIILKQMNP